MLTIDCNRTGIVPLFQYIVKHNISFGIVGITIGIEIDSLDISRIQIVYLVFGGFPSVNAEQYLSSHISRFLVVYADAHTGYGHCSQQAVSVIHMT